MRIDTWRGRLLAAMTLPLLLLLTGCASLTADAVIEDLETIDLSYELTIKDDWGKDRFDSVEEMCTTQLEALSQDHGGLFSELSTEGSDEGGTWICRGSGTVDPTRAGDELQLTETDGEFHLVIAPEGILPADQAQMLFEENLELRISFTFPGTVLESSQGTWVGDRADVTDLRNLYEGVEIRAESAADFPWAGVVLMAMIVGVLVVIAAAVVGVLWYRSRRRRRATA